ncbi:ferredoxin reductase family protein [Myceligenerans indicum]|uniref:Oxidoreductase n=1 Tax=Myceligenerans indicum TaxID=2593663 RepID=A0ABS1LFS7_9MICO|nr:ferredoxin reductase family protein [Myceligenerans indicum]MBL0885056.1 oxidoreductase [Myceligenerans indicum]
MSVETAAPARRRTEQGRDQDSAPRTRGSRPAARHVARTRSGVAGLPDGAVRAAVRVGVLAGCAGVVAFWYAGARTGTGAGIVLTGAGELAGLLGSFLVCVLLVLIARVPGIERAFGMDRLVGWHRSLGTATVLLVLTHVVLMIVGSAALESTTAWAQIPRLLATQPELLEALIGTCLFFAAGLTSVRLIRRFLTYEVWLAVHLTLYLGIYLAFGHQVLGGSHLAGLPVAQAAWILLYAAAGAALLTWRVALPLWRLSRHVFQVDAVHAASPTATSVWLRGKHLEELDVRGGQFFLVRFLTRGHLWSAHPYSVSSLPNEGRLRFTVGALGDHSSAAGALRPGVRVLLEGPFGRFTASAVTSRRTLLVAGGAGIGPIRSLAEELVLHGRDVVVVHRASDPEELALGEELAAGLGPRYIPLTGRRAELGYDPVAPDRLRDAVPDASRREVFVCGPAGLVDAVVRSSRELGVPRSAVHHEELSLS